MDLNFRMHAERTPNPNSIKWVLGQDLLEPGQSAQFEAAPTPAVSELAAQLFGIEGVEGVFLASNFVTVTKREPIQWPDIAQPIVDAIREFVGSGRAALGPEFEFASSEAHSEIAGRIQEILDREIRPAVAKDGGDILFAGFRDGVVELYLQGACSGCPSSTATLRFGIEARLKEQIPEISEVVAL